MSNNGYGEIDFLGMLEKKEEMVKKATHLKLQMEEERKAIDEKYKDFLKDFLPAYNEMQNILKDFNETWGEKEKPYKKELSELTKKYNRLLKEI